MSKTPESAAGTKAEDTKSGSDTADVRKALQAAAKGLTWPSEADKPVKVVVWKADASASTEAALRTGASVPAGATVKSVPVDEFFSTVTTDQDWYGPDEKATAQRFRDLLAALKQHLTDLSAFRVEGPHENDSSLVDVYVIGHVPAPGDGVAGISTQLVET